MSTDRFLSGAGELRPKVLNVIARSNLPVQIAISCLV
jgi:hypothetical protein